MAEYPTEIFGAKKYEKRYGSEEEPYIIYCYDIFGGTFYVSVEWLSVVARFDYGGFHSSVNRSLDEFEGFEKIASMLIKLLLDGMINDKPE
jgi:hypothetical protein